MAKKLYETTFIVNAALEDQEIDAVVSKVVSYLENHGAEIVEQDKWGRKRLAYPIAKKFNGYYVHLIFNMNPSNLPLFERFMVLEDTIIRHLSLVLPEQLLTLRKDKALAAVAEAEAAEQSTDSK